MVRLALVGSLLFALGARAGDLVFTTDLPAGTVVTLDQVRAGKVPAAMQKLTVDAESFSYLEGSVLRFPVRKSDLVLWSAFIDQPELVAACRAALQGKAKK